MSSSILSPSMLAASNVALSWQQSSTNEDTVYASDKQIDSEVAHTARWAAALRALEHERPDALFHDPLSHTFAGEAAISKLRPQMSEYKNPPGGHSHIAIRARAVDDILTEELDDSIQKRPYDRVIQVVNLGAGMCTRAWRIDKSCEASLLWFELDLPDSVALKKSIMKQCKRPAVSKFQSIPYDFNDAERTLSSALMENGFDMDIPTIFILEGFLMYLSYEEIERLVTEMTFLCISQSRIILTSINENFLDELRYPDEDRKQQYPAAAQVANLFVSSWDGGTKGIFERFGWQEEFNISREKYAKRYLNCEMLRYPFPDPAKSTENFVILHRRGKEEDTSFIGFLLDIFACNTNCEANSHYTIVKPL